MKVIYWSGTGNTEQIANLIAEGIEKEGIEAELINISSRQVNSITDNVVVLGCPSMGNEELEDGEFLPWLESVKSELKDKVVVLFGSYGWGDGEWMRLWEENMINLGINIPLDPLIINNSPESDDLQLCINYGKQIAKLTN